MILCSAGCGRLAASSKDRAPGSRTRGMCHGCYERRKVYGDPTAGGKRRDHRSAAAPPSTHWCPFDRGHYTAETNFSRWPNGKFYTYCRECSSLYRRIWRYGISVDDARALVRGDIPCGVRTCDKPATEVDHCHDTGKVRGFLCMSDNISLGHAGDDPEHLRAQADYLEKHLLIQREERSLATQLSLLRVI